MRKRNPLILPLAVLLIAAFYGDSARAGARAAVDPTLVGSDCQRQRVVWSGGVARRGPDRIAPRPIRSRRQSRDESRLRCPDRGNVFHKKRVSDHPEIR